jgi:hypothetical protein
MHYLTLAFGGYETINKSMSGRKRSGPDDQVELHFETYIDGQKQ